MKSESKRLKLTAQNIKSIIVKSNKNLKNISDKEDELDLIVESRRQRRYKERKIESSMFKGSKSSIAQPPKIHDYICTNSSNEQKSKEPSYKAECSECGYNTLVTKQEATYL